MHQNMAYIFGYYFCIKLLSKNFRDVILDIQKTGSGQHFLFCRRICQQHFAKASENYFSARAREQRLQPLYFCYECTKYSTKYIYTLWWSIKKISILFQNVFHLLVQRCSVTFLALCQETNGSSNLSQGLRLLCLRLLDISYDS